MLDLQNSACQKCGLCQGRKKVVNGKGSLTAKIMLIGEWPGSPEDESGDVWGGPIGKEVKRLLWKAGISAQEVFLTTVVRCYPKAPPPERIREPKKDEIEACADYLDKEIAAIQPTIIVPMGTIAVKRIFGKVSTIKGTRGAEVWSEKYNCKVIPIYHPMTLRRSPEFEGFTIEDLRRIKKSSEYKELTPRQLGKYVIVDTPEKFDQLITRLNTVPAFSYDIETNSLNFMTGKVLCISFSWQSGTACILPITRYNGRPEEHIEMVKRKTKKKVNGQWVETGVKEIPKKSTIVIDEYFDWWGDKKDYILEKLRKTFANDAIKIAHNGKFDNKFLFKYMNIMVNKFWFDTMLAHHLLNENAEGMHDLKECAQNYTDMGGYNDPLEKWFDENTSGSKKSRNYAHVPPEVLYPYAGMDADVTFRLYELFKPRIEEENLQSLMGKLVMPLNETLTEAELTGVMLDKDRLEQFKSKLLEEISKREIELRKKCAESNLTDVDDEFNFSSNDQLAGIFFDKLKLPVNKLTAKSQKPAVDEEVLKSLAPLHPIPKMVLEYREVVGVLSKYVEGLEKRVDANYALHSSFLIHGTVTGRLSSSDPNLQNIPRSPVILSDGTEIKIKSLFIPRPGKVWIESDYGQAEFRHWANYSQDPDMIRDIVAADDGSGPDIHKKTASIAWGVTIDQVTKEMREAAKRIVFGIMYGRQAESIADQISQDTGKPFPVTKAQEIINQFLARYPIAKQWLDMAIITVKQYKQIRDIFGRVRRLPGIDSPVQFVREEHERLAMNSPIQAAASDMTCNAANRMRLAFKTKGIKGQVLILVHDAIYCEVDVEDFQRGIDTMKEEMERPIAGVNVPMRAEFKVGKNWGEAKTYEFKKELVAR
jgi:uracil-DNA glycosylase family 4